MDETHDVVDVDENDSDQKKKIILYWKMFPAKVHRG